MNTTTNTALPLPHLAGDENVDKLKAHMKAWQGFATPAEMLAAINKAAGATENFMGLRVKMQGIERNEAGEYVLTDASKYADSIPIFAYVGGQSKGTDGKNVPVIKAVLAFGIPTVESTLANAADLAAKVLNKEFRHVYFRNFRDASTDAELEAGFAAAPVGIEAFAASHARTAADELDTEAFDQMWTGIRKSLVSSNPVLAKEMPSKSEVIKAIRSKSYAEGMYPRLEGINLFLVIAASMAQVAAKLDEPLDVSAIKEWAQNRNSTHIEFRRASEAELATLKAFDVSKAAEALGIG